MRKSWNSRLIGGGPMPTNLLRAPRVLNPALPTPDPDTSNTKVKCGVHVVKNRFGLATLSSTFV